jgi:hypothetical protein
LTDSLSRFMPLDEFKRQHLRLPGGRVPSDRTIQNYIRDGKVPVIKIGNVRYVDIAIFAERCRQQLEPEPKRPRGRPRAENR